MFRAQLGTLLCVTAYVQASIDLSSPEAANETLARAAVYYSCNPGYYDLAYSRYEHFYDYKKASRSRSPQPNQMQVQCQNSTFCSVQAAKISSVTCRNTAVGSPSISWDCDPSFYGSGYSMARSNIDCELDYGTCVLDDSCIFAYVPQVSGRPGGKGSAVSVFAAFGGIFVFCAVGLVIFLCAQKRNRSSSSRGATTTTVISTAPPPVVPTQAYPATQACPSAPCYPSHQDYPPPYTAPYPSYSPQYGQPEPPKYAPY